MNQAIQVLDGFTYISVKKAIKVEIMFSGQILACYVCGLDREGLTNLYNSKQFEIEDMIEQKLEQDKINSDGEIWLTAEDVNKF